MEPDPIRQAFEKWWPDAPVVLATRGEACEAVFEAGAKWAARESAKMHENIDPACDHNADGCGAMHAIIQYRDEIRKHFGVED